MARYNSKRIYNRLIPNGGARYNSAPFSISVFDYSDNIADSVKNITRNTIIKDNNIARIENITFGFNVSVNDNIATLEKTDISTNLGIISDLGNIVEIISLLPFPINITDNNLTTNETVNINSVIIYNDSGNGIDSVTYRLGTFYNTKLSYNKGYNKGGANYNTSKQFVIMLSENGTMTVATEITPDRLSMADSNNTSNDTILPISSMSPISELINVQEGFVLFPHMIIVDEKGHTSISTDVRLAVAFNDYSSLTNDSALFNIDINALDEGTNKDVLSLPLMQVNTSDNISMADLINIAFSDINLIDNVLINELANISNDIFLNDENISAIDIVVYRSGVFYNTKLQYNKGINKGGSIYNSSKHLIIVVSERGIADEKEAYVVQACFVNDTGQGNDNSNITNEIPKMFDSGTSADSFKNITNNVTVIDTGNVIDTIYSILNNLNVNDNAYGVDFMSLATTYFLIDADNILSPLGVLITRDNREEILPSIKNYTESIPGKHGEYKFKTELKGKTLELTVVTDEGLTPTQKQDLKNLFEQYLSPLNGEKSLTFANDIERQYKVRYSGRINIENYPTWFKFVIPFKMSSSFITGSFENVQIGSGTIENKGNVDTHMTIEIGGLATNPSLTIDGELLSYAGTINAGETLVIDTKKKTAKIGNTNVLDNWCGKFPILIPEAEIEVMASNNIVIKWRESWL